MRWKNVAAIQSLREFNPKVDACMIDSLYVDNITCSEVGKAAECAGLYGDCKAKDEIRQNWKLKGINV